jgi:hypothetical protein
MQTTIIDQLTKYLAPLTLQRMLQSSKTYKHTRTLSIWVIVFLLHPHPRIAFESFVFNSSSPEETTIWASGFGRNTTAKRYVQRSGGGTYAVGSYTLVITMDRGNVTDMTWIDGCSECSCTGNGGQSLTCPDYACVTNNCAIPEADCTAKGMDTCDMKIFIGWVGTDSRGRPCTSSGSLPYNFLQFGLTPAYRAAAGVDNQWLFNLNFRGT